MTEPLLIALTLLAVALLMRVVLRRDADRARRGSVRRASVGAGAVRARVPDALRGLAGDGRRRSSAAVWALWRRGDAAARARSRASRAIAVYPAVADRSRFLIFSRIVVGAWFANDFFVPENPAQGHPFDVARGDRLGRARAERLRPAGRRGGIGAAGRSSCSDSTARRTRRAHPAGAARDRRRALAGFLDGHPYRIRYMVPLHRGRGGRRRRRRPASWTRGARRSRSLLVAARRVRAAPARRVSADGRRSAVGSAERRGARPGDARASRRATAARRSWRAWDRSATTCRSCRAAVSRSATSCTRATATSG